MFLVGGGFFLSFSLKQVQIRVTYSDASPLKQFTNEQRSLLMQGQSTPPAAVYVHHWPMPCVSSYVCVCIANLASICLDLLAPSLTVDNS